MIEELVSQIQAKRNQILEDFARAYVAETGLHPSECELCEQWQGDKMVWWFRKHQPTEVHPQPNPERQTSDASDQSR